MSDQVSSPMSWYWGVPIKTVLPAALARPPTSSWGSFSSCLDLHRKGGIVPTLQVRTLRPREVKQLAPVHSHLRLGLHTQHGFSGLLSYVARAWTLPVPVSTAVDQRTATHSSHAREVRRAHGFCGSQFRQHSGDCLPPGKTPDGGRLEGGGLESPGDSLLPSLLPSCIDSFVSALWAGVPGRLSLPTGLLACGLST